MTLKAAYVVSSPSVCDIKIIGEFPFCFHLSDRAVFEHCGSAPATGKQLTVAPMMPEDRKQRLHRTLCPRDAGLPSEASESPTAALSPGQALACCFRSGVMVPSRFLMG